MLHTLPLGRRYRCVRHAVASCATLVSWMGEYKQEKKSDTNVEVSSVLLSDFRASTFFFGGSIQLREFDV